MPEVDAADQPRPGDFKTVYVDRVNRFALEIDERTGRTFLSFPVSNPYVEYLEYYEVDRATFDSFTAEPDLARQFAERAKRRELDHLLLFKPGSLRGEP